MFREEDIQSALRLIHCPSLSSAKQFQLIQHFASFAKILESDTTELASLGLKREQIDFIVRPEEKSLQRDLAWLKGESHHLVSILDAEYPALLKQIADPPAFLFVNGNVRILDQIQVAIVGSRRPSSYGKRMAEEISVKLSNLGIVITSGLALGIDGHAQASVVKAGNNTVAVLGNGVDNIYPVSHQALAHSIVEAGAIISEFAAGTPPLPFHFPRRNRIISGLSVATVVVEAAERSGSLITAHCAMEQGREVFAVPGSIKNPLAKGCHALIKEGAGIVEEIDDILLEIPALATYVVKQQNKKTTNQNINPQLTVKQKDLLEMMGFEACHPDELIERSQLTADEVSSILLDLELNGLVETDLSGSFVRVNN